MRSQTTLHIVPALIVAAAAALPAAATAQGTPADYARAEGLRARYENAVVDIAGPATAIGRSHRFWYRESVKGGEQFMTIDADIRQKGPAFDHGAVARSLSDVTGKRYSSLKLPFATLAFVDDGSAFTVTLAGARYRCGVADSTCHKLDPEPRAGRGARDEDPRRSPDGQWEALINNYNLAIRRNGAHALTCCSSWGSSTRTSIRHPRCRW